MTQYDIYICHMKAKELEQFETRYPNEPWLWRTDWEKGFALSEEITQSKIPIGMGIFVLLISAYPVFAIPSELAKGKYQILVALLFPIVGVLLLIQVIQGTLKYLRAKRFGETKLQYGRGPVALGKEFVGAVTTSKVLKPGTDINVYLECVRRYESGSGTDSNTWTQVMWQESLKVKCLSTGVSTQIPVRFQIPSDCRETYGAGTREEILWRVRCQSEVEGLNFAATFTIPVFKTDEVESTNTVQSLAQDSGEKIAPPSNPTIKLTREGDGIRLNFRAGRNIGLSLILLVFGFLVVLGGGLGVYAGSQIHIVIGVIFGIPFGLVILPIVFISLLLLFGSSETIVRRSGVVVINKLLFFRKEKEIKIDHISDIILDSSMQSGNQMYWDLKVQQKSGKPIVCGTGIADKDEAKWILTEMRKVLGLS